MRKIVRSALTVAVSIAALGGLYSCKDSNEDLIYEKYAELSQQLESVRNELLNNDTKIEEALQAQINGLSSLISALQTEVANLKTQLDNLNLGDGCTCAGTISTIQQQITNINQTITTLQGDVAASQAALEGLGDKTVSEAISDAIAQNNADIKDLLADLVTLQQVKDLLAEQLVGYATTDQITALQQTFGNYYTKDEINSLLAGLNTDCSKANDAYDKAVEAYALAEKALAAANAAGSGSGSTGGGSTDSSCTCDLEAIVAQAKQDLADAKELLEQEIEDAKTELKDAIEQATAGLASTEYVNTTIGDLKDAYEAADKKLQDQIDDLKTRVEANESAIKAIEANLAEMVTSVIVQGTVNTPLGSLALPVNLRSNILCAYYGQTENNVEFPSTKSAGLVDATQFLTEADFNVLSNPKAISLKNGETILDDSQNNAGKVYVTVNPTGVDYKGLSVSLVNSLDEESPITLSSLQPSNDKLTFGYSRSEANGFYEAYAKLDADNISKSAITIGSELKSAVKSVYKNRTISSLASLASAMNSQFNNVLDANAVKVTRKDGKSVYSQYGIAAFSFKPLSFMFDPSISYKLPNIPEFPDLDNIKLDLSVKEFKFELNLDFDDIKLDLSDVEFNIGSVNLDDNTVEVEYYYEVPAFEWNEEKGNYVVKVDGNGEMVMETKTGTTTVDLANIIGDLSEKIGEQISDQFKNVMGDLSDKIQEQLIDKIANQINDQINNQIADQINTNIQDVMDDLVDQINGKISNGVDKYNNYVTKLQTLVNRFNSVINRINNFAGNINYYLQATLLYENNGSYHRVSSSRNNPTLLKIGAGNSVALHPTSLTAELAAPAYKKFVGVTNVWDNTTKVSAQDGDAKCLAVAKSANSQQYIDEVFNGSRYGVPFVAQAGYTYEIVYSALDYQGKISQRKFYIKVL